jgi:tRNA dimethylallyltransferase
VVATPKLVVIVGETASGKTALAIELAQRFNGEIIAADSRTLYRGMDIATAKPSAAEQAAVRHHLIDVSTPDKPLNVSDFKKLATEAINDITARGKLPFLVGGTGLYIDAILYDFQFNNGVDQALRDSLGTKTLAELQGMLAERDIPLPENPLNKRHLIRKLETNGAVAAKGELRPNTLVLGLQLDREVLNERIEQRIDVMFASGVIEEAAKLKATYSGELDPLKTPGYKALWQLLDDAITEQEAKALFAQADRHLAKRQRTWFKRNKSIHWLSNRDKSTQFVDLITTLLNT